MTDKYRYMLNLTVGEDPHTILQLYKDLGYPVSKVLQYTLLQIQDIDFHEKQIQAYAQMKKDNPFLS